MVLAHDLWALPGAAQALQAIGQELAEGLSLCIVDAVPESLEDFRSALEHELQVESGLRIYALNLADLKSLDLPGILMAVVPDTDHFAIEDFMLPEAPDVLLLHGFERLENSARSSVFRFMRQWAEYCHTYGGSKSLCLIVPGCAADAVQDPRFGTTSARIKLRILVGVPSALETRLMLRADVDGTSSTAESLWREQLASSIAGSDLELANLLGDRSLHDLADIHLALADYAEMNCWNGPQIKASLSSWSPVSKGSLPQIPQHIQNIKMLWKQYTVYTYEYGEEIHPAGLYLMGRLDEIRRRVWRAQMTLVMPLIDEIRIKIYAVIKGRIPNTWQHTEIPEIGELKYSLEKLYESNPDRKRYYEIVCRARDARNKLAHMQVISLSEFARLWEAGQGTR